MDLEEVIGMAEESSPLEVSIPTPVLISLEGVEGYVKASLVGFLPGKYLIVAPPRMDPRIKQKLVEGVLVVTKYFYRGSVYAFQSHILGIITRPVTLLLLSYPQIVSRQEFRRTPRVECHIHAMVKIGETELNGIVVDISRNGCRVMFKPSSSQPLLDVDVESELFLEMSLDGSIAPITVRGVVRNKRIDKQMMSLGLEFRDVNSDVEGALSLFVGQVEEIDAIRERLDRES